VAGEQHQERDFDPGLRPGWRLEQVHRGQGRCAGGLRPGLLKDLEKYPDYKILDGKFTAVQQAVGCNKPATEGARYIAEFVEHAKKSGLIASLIEKHKVKGLSVAPLA
jgi:polar amino acid transport system substrate-binding protein